MQPRGPDDAAELLQSLPDPVIGCDAGGAVVYWSRAAEEAYGYLAAEAEGRRVAALLHTRFPAPLLEITEELADLGRWEGRIEHRCKDGRTVSVESRWVARRDPQGRWVGSVVVERELSGEAAPPAPAPASTGAAPAPADAALAPADAAPAAGDAVPAPADAALAPADAAPAAGDAVPDPARALAHDINNALAIIVNYTAFVSAQLETTQGAPSDAARDAMRADLHEIQTAAERAVELAHRLLG